MKLEGSCHCQAVRFSVESAHPYPFNLCYCSICRKTAGGGGFAINLGAHKPSLQIASAEHIRVYQATLKDEDGNPRKSQLERAFCSLCGSALWCWHPSWPELMHPHASCIDTPLPRPPELTHLMLNDKPDWVIQPQGGPGDLSFGAYPEESLAEWHERLGLVAE